MEIITLVKLFKTNDLKQNVAVVDQSKFIGTVLYQMYNCTSVKIKNILWCKQIILWELVSVISKNVFLFICSNYQKSKTAKTNKQTKKNA